MSRRVGDVPTSSPRGEDMRQFRDLLDSARQLNSETDGDTFMLERDLEQLSEDTTKCALKHGGALVDVAIGKANYLLARKGYDSDMLLRNLDAIKPGQTQTTPLDYASVEDEIADIDSYVRHEEDISVVSVIEEAKEETFKSFRKELNETLSNDWSIQKNELLEKWGARSLSAGLGTGSSRLGATYSRKGKPDDLNMSLSDLGTSTGFDTQKSFLGSSRSFSNFDQKMARYAENVVWMVENLRQPGILRGFVERCILSSSEAADDRKEKRIEIVDVWKLLQSQVEALETLFGSRLTSSLHAFESTSSSPCSSLSAAASPVCHAENEDVKLVLRTKSREFLEAQYVDVINQSVRSNPVKASIGGSPSLHARIKGYLCVKFDRPTRPWPVYFEDIDVKEDFPLWAQIYYTLRCGDYDHALNIAERHPASEGTFALYFKQWLDSKNRTLEPKAWCTMIIEYHKLLGSCTDPYKLLLYNLMACVDHSNTAKFQTVLSTAQDFLWFKLNVIHCQLPSYASYPQISAVVFELKDLQDTLIKYGIEHFRNPLLFFQVLVMSQQYERAVYFLYERPDYQTEAVHFGIVFYLCGLIHSTKIMTKHSELAANTTTVDAPASSLKWKPGPNFGVKTNHNSLVQQLFQCPFFDDQSSNNEITLNFPKILKFYTSSFLVSNPECALHYYCLINLGYLRHYLIRQLALKLCDSNLFGYVNNEGNIVPGVIFNLLGADDWKDVVIATANDFVYNGMFERAVELFELGQQFQEIMDILIEQMSRVLTMFSPDRSRVKALVEHFGPRLVVQSLENASVFDLLVRLLRFFDFYHGGRYEEALVALEETELLPAVPDAMLISQKAEAFKSFPAVFVRNMSEIMLAGMTSLYKLYEPLAQGASRGLGGVDQKMKILREKSNAIVMFAGLVQYRLPSDINSKLIRMEVNMS